MKRCPACGESKPLSEFHRNPRSSTGRASRCKPCACAATAAWKAENPDRVAEHAARRDRSGEPARKSPEANRRTVCRRYGLTPMQYDALLERQGGGCAICGAPPGERSLAIDHDHDTGLVRGLLCSPCNLSIGNMRDDPARLRAAADYLEGAMVP